MRTFLFSLLGTFCPYKYSAWKATIREQVRLSLLLLFAPLALLPSVGFCLCI